MNRTLGAFLVLLLAPTVMMAGVLKLTPRHIALVDGRSFDLNVPEGFEIRVPPRDAPLWHLRQAAFTSSAGPPRVRDAAAKLRPASAHR